ncbi:MAG: hypothetical protein IJ644_08160 [Oscillospiraceae bacterium]|nr:hypothetical protein [Oscillospiraceae bacterium]
MTKIRLYIPKIILTFLLVFLCIGTELSFLIQHNFLTYKAFETVANQQALDEKAYSALESYFKSRANSTGIPPEVYLDAITQEDMKQGIHSSISSAYGYLYQNVTFGSGYDADPPVPLIMDFTELEVSITEFFNQYADENGYEKDEVFQQKVQSAIDEAETKILYTADVFRFGTIYEHGWLAKLRKFLDIFRKLMTVLCIASAVILLCLILCCKGRFSELLYWLGLIGVISGLLISVPCLYLLRTDYFSAFVVKDLQIYSAVTGYLQYITKQTGIAFAIIGAAGIIFLILFPLIQKISHTNQTTAE